MRDWKEIAKKFLYPPIWIVIVLTIFCTIALVEIFVNGWEMTVLEFIIRSRFWNGKYEYRQWF